MFSPQAIQNSRMASHAVDNGIATATCSAGTAERAFLFGFIASFSAAVAAIKTITITYTPEGAAAPVTIVIDWNFANGPCAMSLPGVVHGDYANDPTVALAASGTGGTTGRIYAFYSVG